MRSRAPASSIAAGIAVEEKSPIIEKPIVPALQR